MLNFGKFVLILLFLFETSLGFAARSKTVALSESEVFDVNTSLGYSTLLQFDSRPTSAILGDQDSFKVEYVGNSLSIKPLTGSSKTNLFVFTEYEKFNFRLSTVSSSHVDYSVRIKRKIEKTVPPSSLVRRAKLVPVPSELTERPLGQKVRSGGYTLTLISIAFPPSHTAAIIRFSLSWDKADSKVQPLARADFAILQGAEAFPIHNLFLDRLELTSNSPVTGTLVVRTAKFAAAEPVFLRVSPKGMSPTQALRVALPLASKPRRGVHEADKASR